MRLINVVPSLERYEIHEFFGEKIPEYAILSHTWGAEEVTFQDMVRLDDTRIAYKERLQKDRVHLQRSEKRQLGLGVDRHLLHR
jgi:hypothetical protein